jgi:hypothetical protein
MTGEMYPNPSELDKEALLYRSLCIQILSRSQFLWMEAIASDEKSIDKARAKRRFFIDRYVTKAPLNTPNTDARAILLTPDGKELPPVNKPPHVFLYFRNRLNVDDLNIPVDAVWAEQVAESSAREMMVVNATEAFTYPGRASEHEPLPLVQEPTDIPDGNGVLVMPFPNIIPYGNLRAFRDVLRTYQVAPQARTPLSP